MLHMAVVFSFSDHLALTLIEYSYFSVVNFSAFRIKLHIEYQDLNNFGHTDLTNTPRGCHLVQCTPLHLPGVADGAMKTSCCGTTTENR